jgi:hypothetical protein
MVVQEGTIAACNKNSYTLADGDKVKLTTKEELAKQVPLRHTTLVERKRERERASPHTRRFFHQVRNCVMYDHKSQFEFSFPATHGETTIEVIEKDCLEAALHLKLNKGVRPCKTLP